MPYLAEMSWVDARSTLGSHVVALLPVGSIEQHGPQNPLGTDYIIAWELAREAARRTNALLLPPIPYGVSEHHSGFPGTIWVDEKVFEDYVYSVVKALAKWGIKKVVVVNGHGGNLNALIRVSKRVRKLNVLLVVFQWWTVTADIFREKFGAEGLGHAAAMETSLIAHLAPHAVKLERAVDETPHKPLEGAYTYWYTHELSKTGVFGRARNADPKVGEEVFRESINRLVELVNRIKAFGLNSP